jgi:acyl carrier protein
LAGKGLARGYHGRPDLTERSFPQFAGERVYRTGDLVRRLADGTIEFVGRADHQVKLRGYRIELAEIAAVLTGHPDVADAVVTVRGDQDDQRLVGYVQSVDVDQRALTDFARGRLPEYMVPAAIVVLPEFPLTSSGKIDRLALPEPDQTSGAAEWVEPRTGTEQAVAAIWSEVLGVPRVGAHDDFFALGGHSIVSLKVISKVRKTFGVRLSFRDLLDKPTVAELADQIEETLLAALEAEAAQAATAE